MKFLLLTEPDRLPVCGRLFSLTRTTPTRHGERRPAVACFFTLLTMLSSEISPYLVTSSPKLWLATLTDQDLCMDPDANDYSGFKVGRTIDPLSS